MVLIDEELHKGGEFEMLNFSAYTENLLDKLFRTYGLGNIDINLIRDLEENLFFDMDTAIPLGMVVNELVSNSFKHAFPGKNKGEIQIKLRREKTWEYSDSMVNKREGCRNTSFILTVSDNGISIPENLEIEYLDSPGFQLVVSLVDKLDGEFELRRKNGTEFTMRFT
jgi:two-component sensor histidine kinase